MGIGTVIYVWVGTICVALAAIFLLWMLPSGRRRKHGAIQGGEYIEVSQDDQTVHIESVNLNTPTVQGLGDSLNLDQIFASFAIANKLGSKQSMQLHGRDRVLNDDLREQIARTKLHSAMQPVHLTYSTALPNVDLKPLALPAQQEAPTLPLGVTQCLVPGQIQRAAVEVKCQDQSYQPQGFRLAAVERQAQGVNVRPVAACADPRGGRRSLRPL